MASNGTTIIGRETRIRGRVTGAQDVEVQGHIEGELVVTGDVSVDNTATIAADVRGRRITVRGAIKGDVSADEAIALEDGARVVGDLRAPRVAIARGGLVKGYVETGKADGKRSAPAAATRHHVAPAPHKAAPARPAAASSKPVAKAHAAHGKGGKMTLSGGKAPPPVVPVLKKGTKAALTKKR
jgi:cytoskeletal protein CcmA (bactofilin family)